MKLKIVFKWILVIFVGVVILVPGYIKFLLPNVGSAPDLKVERTPERIARGAYLANHVTVCIDCHSKRDWSRFSGPPIAGTFGMGGDLFDQKFGFPGVYYANLFWREGGHAALAGKCDRFHFGIHGFSRRGIGSAS